MTRLFLENKEVNLGENFSCPITKTFEDIQNPTSIINAYSKTITIPHTQNNDRLFGFLFNPDRLTAREGTTLTGIYFDPYQKIDFRLEYNDYVLMTGYLKVLTVTSKGYECSLNGELGKIFQELQKITFDETKYEGDEKTKYWIDGSQYVDETMSRQLIVKSWNSNGQQDLTLKKIGDTGYSVTDIIGFTPNNSYTGNFDYKSVENSGDIIQESTYMESYYKSAYDKDAVTIFNADEETIIGDGFLPLSNCQFRSYLQVPFIYFNKFVQIFNKKAKDTTGYDIQFDLPENIKKNMAMLLYKPEEETPSITSLETDNEEEGTLIQYIYRSSPATGYYYYSPEQKISYLNLRPKTINNPSGVGTINSQILSFPKNSGIMRLDGNFSICVRVQTDEQLDPGTVIDLRQDISLIEYANIIKVSLDVLDINNNVVKNYYIGDIVPKNLPKDRYKVNGVGSAVYKFNTITMDTPSILNKYQFSENKMSFKDIYIVKSEVGEKFKLRLKVNMTYATSSPFETIAGQKNAEKHIVAYSINAGQNFKWVGEGINPTLSAESFPFTFYNVLYFINSYSRVTLNTFWDNSISPYEKYINFTKSFGYIWDVDEINKVIKVVKRADYFKDYKVYNYDKKLDKTKDFGITPITFENKYVCFNEKQNNALNSQYKSLYSVNYGDLKVTTFFNFKDTTKTIIEKPSVILYSPNVIDVNTLYLTSDGNQPIPYNIFQGNFVNFGDKFTQQFGAFVFIEKAVLPTPADPTYIWRVTDTSELQFKNQTFCNFSRIELLKSSNPNLTVTSYLAPADYNGFYIYYGTPKTAYTYSSNKGSDNIYSKYWDNYIKERYNTQNKIVTCYLKLTPIDYANFKFNHFVIIENQLYIINKIYDYDITSNDSTKVDLITIQNIDGYCK